MTLDELGPLPEDDSSCLPFPLSHLHSKLRLLLARPDIESILSKTPRPALRKVAPQTLLRSQGICPRISTSNPDYRRRASKGVARPTPSWHGHNMSFVQRNRSLSHGMPPKGDGDEKRTGSDEKTGEGDESDSSVDLHTPLP